jgi:hypothetical protein
LEPTGVPKDSIGLLGKSGHSITRYVGAVSVYCWRVRATTSSKWPADKCQITNVKSPFPQRNFAHPSVSANAEITFKDPSSKTKDRSDYRFLSATGCRKLSGKPVAHFQKAFILRFIEHFNRSGQFKSFPPLGTGVVKLGAEDMRPCAAHDTIGQPVARDQN